MKTYHSTQRVIMGSIRFHSSGSDYVYTARNEEEEKAIESSYFFKREIIVAFDEPKKETAPAEVKATSKKK